MRAGGGLNHRESLSDAVLIKDNHLAHAGSQGGRQAPERRWPGRIVEVECDTLEQVARRSTPAPDIVLLDNMTPAQVAEVRRAHRRSRRPGVLGRGLG